MAPRMEHLHMISLPRRRMATLPFALLLALLPLTLLGPASALARGGGGGGGGDRPEVRVGGCCGRGASSTLKLKARDGGIEAEFEVHSRARTLWRVAFVQERGAVWRRRPRGAPPGWPRPPRAGGREPLLLGRAQARRLPRSRPGLRAGDRPARR